MANNQPHILQWTHDGIVVRRSVQGFTALSSSGMHWYTLGDGTTCECEGYYWRRSCKHVRAVQQIIRHSLLAGPAIAQKEREIEEKYGQLRRRVV